MMLTLLSGFAFCVQRFFLCGRFIFGPDVRSLAVTIFLIVAPVACFCVFVGRHLLHHYGNAGIAIIVVAVVYTVYVSSANFILSWQEFVWVSCSLKDCACLVILFQRVALLSNSFYASIMLFFKPRNNFCCLKVLIRVFVTCLIFHTVHLMCVVLAGLLLVVGFF
jgi:hypothetical protein